MQEGVESFYSLLYFSNIFLPKPFNLVHWRKHCTRLSAQRLATVGPLVRVGYGMVGFRESHGGCIWSEGTPIPRWPPKGFCYLVSKGRKSLDQEVSKPFFSGAWTLKENPQNIFFKICLQMKLSLGSGSGIHFLGTSNTFWLFYQWC